jgi:hypothetical protein
MLKNMNETHVLPNDLAACHAIIAEQQAKLSEQGQKIDEQGQKIDEQHAKLSELNCLTAEQARAILELEQAKTQLEQLAEEQKLTINELLQQAYRNRSERYREAPGQLKLDFGNTPEAADAAEGLAQAVEEAEITIAAHKRRVHKPRKPRNESLPAHLPREEVTLEASPEATHCEEHGERKLIGYDRQETLVFQRPKLKVRVTLIPKYACEGHAECGVIPKAIDGDAKSQRIHEVFTEARAEGKPSVSGRMWAYRSLTVPINVFDFTVSRHRDGPDEFLVASNFTGTILADCYSGYQGIGVRSDARIVRAACNAHARRKIFDVRLNHPLLASRFLAMYQELYDIEDRGRTLSFADRLSLRQSEARPVWQRLRELVDGEECAKLLPKDKFTEALGYLRNHWNELQVYLGDGRLPIDNNETEQLMKQVAIGRKNWLFVGSVAAGERAADFFTVVSSAVRNDLDVWAYVKDLLDRLLAGDRDYAAMRPDHWAALHPQHIRVYRAEERRDRAAAQQIRRADRRRRSKPA